MNIDIRSTESTGSAVRLGQSESVGNRRASAWWNHPALVRIGGVAGVLSPLPLLAAGLSPPLPARTCAERIPVGGHPGRDPDRDVRVGTAGFPPARWPAIVRVAGMATVVALLGIAGFFAALGTEDLLATVAGTSRFLSDNEAITAPAP